MEKKNAGSNQRTLSYATIALYGLGGMFPNGWILLLNGYYMMIFMTDIIKLPTVLAAAVYSGIQWWKLIAMLISGVLIDGVHLKSGKYRGWILITRIIQAVSFPLAYADLGLSVKGAAIVVCAAQGLLLLGYNIGWTSIRTLPAAMAKTSRDVTWLSSASSIGGGLPNLIWGVASTAVLSIPLWAGTTNAYCGVCVLCSIIMLISGFVMYKVAEPYDNSDTDMNKGAAKREKLTLAIMLKNLKGPMIPYFAASTLASAQSGFFSTLLVYYTTYVLENPGLSASILGITTAINLIGCFFVPTVTKYISKKNAHIVTQFVYAACYVLLGFFGRNAAIFIGVRCLMSAVGCVSGVVGYTFPIDIGDYNEMHGIYASRAFLTSVGGTTTRLGHAVSTTVAAFGLAAIGYAAGAPVDAIMCSKIIMLMVAGPAALALLSGFVMFAYKVDEKAIDEYRKNRANNAAS